jgi:hypothetical protein
MLRRPEFLNGIRIPDTRVKLTTIGRKADKINFGEDWNEECKDINYR